MLDQPTARFSAEDAETDRDAFNAAFYELGLRWHWDSDTHQALSITACERTRVRRYLEAEQPHLLRAYDAEFLTDAILSAKARHQSAPSNRPPRVIPRFNWADARSGEIGA